MSSRRIRFPGPLGSRSYGYLQPDLFFSSGANAQYGLPTADLMPLTMPTGVDVDFLVTEKNSSLPGWDRVPPQDALEICKKLNDVKMEQKHEPVKGTNVFYHVTLGPQATSHHPFSIHSTRDPRNSAELDLLLSADINVQFHEDDKQGFEFTATMQGSRNFILLDPNRSNPDFQGLNPADIQRGRRATQAQLQLQLAYAFKAIEVGKLKFSFSVLFQLVGGANIQYDPTMKKVALTWGKGAAYGFGLDIQHQSIKHWKLTVQGTQGAGASGSGALDFNGPTLDNSIQGGLKFEW